MNIIIFLIMAKIKNEDLQENESIWNTMDGSGSAVSTDR